MTVLSHPESPAHPRGASRTCPRCGHQMNFVDQVVKTTELWRCTFCGLANVAEYTKMKLDFYQKAAARTSGNKEYEQHINKISAGPYDYWRLLVAVLGLNGEAGELTEMVKHWIGHGHELNLTNIKEELGDLMWYIAEIATTCGFELEDILSDNLQKLAARYPDGFSKEDSLDRKDKQ